MNEIERNVHSVEGIREMSNLRRVLLCLICCPMSFQSSDGKAPNMIIIVADDLGWGDVSFHGSSQVHTPDIDDLASSGVVLNNYYVSPICTPSRGALLSGRHPIHTGLQYSVIQGETPYGLPLEFDILPQYLKELGYSTHAIGKWHIGHYTKKHMPTNRGFDTFFGYLVGQEDYYDHASLQSIGWGMDLRRNLDGVAEQYFGQYSTTMYTKEAIDVIRRHNETSNGPLFLYLAYQAVHTGNQWSTLQVPKEFEDRFEHIENEGRRKMVAMGNALNDAVAEVIQSLNKFDLLDNSIIVFTSDNGGATGATEGPRIENSWGSNWPLRGTKFTLWEGGIRANGFVWSPLLNQSSYTYNGLMHATDWLPTLFAATGGDVSKLPSNLYGKNLWPDLNRGAKDGFIRKELLHNIDDVQNVFAIRSGDYKLKFGTIRAGSFDGWYLPPGEEIESRENQRENFSTRRKSRIREILQKTGTGFKQNPDLPITVQCGEKRDTSCDMKNDSPCDIENDSPCDMKNDSPCDIENGTPCDMKKEKLCLFNISQDPCEFNNLADKLPNIVDELLQMVDSYNRTAVQPGNVPPDPKANPELNNYYWGPWIEL